jgi:membrane protein implicated in regulation of membrane protease activity
VSLTWLANALLAIAFPAVYEALGEYTFLLFALAAAASGAFTWRFVPETRGKTSAQIAHAFEMLE